MTQTIQIAADDTISPVRALHSLTAAQADQIGAGLSSLSATWSIERHESCDGHLSLVLAHHSDDTILIVDRDQAGINVSLMLGDVMHSTTQSCITVNDTVTAIRAIKAVAVSPVVELQRHTA